MANLKVTLVPQLSDNYVFLLECQQTGEVAVVDCPDAEPMIALLDEKQLTPSKIFNTHHHWDHVGGNEDLISEHEGLAVYAHSSDASRIPGLTTSVDHGASFEVAGMTFGVLHIPGHTTGAVAYTIADCVFTGDTLFAAGCGRLFEGTPEMMYESLNVKLAALPPSTRVYCGHEYTASNLEFALTLEPDNQALLDKQRAVQAIRAQGKPTVPTTLEEEFATNPFMRCDQPAVIQAVRSKLDGEPRPAAVLAAVRAAKDAF